VNKDRVVGQPVRDGVDSVDYFYCEFCGFLFSKHLDECSNSVLDSLIYNEDYWTRIDLEDRSAIPLTFIQRFMVGRQRRILDYGCGRGQGVSMLRSEGYDAFGYDIGNRFVSQYCSNDWGELPDHYDFIFSFEVVEHLTRPLVLFEDLGRLLVRNGIFFFTTYLYDESLGREFWYIAPRNGHVSIYSRRTLQYLAASYGFAYVPLFRPHHHLFLRCRNQSLRSVETVLRYGIGVFVQSLGSKLCKTGIAR
jgi:SAM-dependent methyltransferase